MHIHTLSVLLVAALLSTGAAAKDKRKPETLRDIRAVSCQTKQQAREVVEEWEATYFMSGHQRARLQQANMICSTEWLRVRPNARIIGSVIARKGNGVFHIVEVEVVASKQFLTFPWATLRSPRKMFVPYLEPGSDI